MCWRKHGVDVRPIYLTSGTLMAQTLSAGDIERLIRDAGRAPIERDTLYNVVRVPQLATA